MERGLSPPPRTQDPEQASLCSMLAHTYTHAPRHQRREEETEGLCV